MRTLSELTDVDDPAWPLVTGMIAASPVTVVRLPHDAARGEACLMRLQVTTRSYLGAMALHCGGLLVDDGWIRVYGGAGTGLPGGLPDLEAVGTDPAAADSAAWPPPAGLLLAHDVLGGVFALNGGDPRAAGRPGEPGEMVYFAPDSLAWEPLEAGHGDWLTWLLAGEGLADFYAAVRRPGWEDEVACLGLDQGISVYPPLWSREARIPSDSSHKPVPMNELLGIARDFAREETDDDPGHLGTLPPTP